jgi:hypothetical protein
LKSKTKATIVIVLGLILLSPFLAYEAFLFWAHDFDPDYNKIDECLDRGGIWDCENRTCVFIEE